MKAVLAFIVAALALFGLAFGKPLTDGTEEESFAVANEYEEQDIRAPAGLQEAFEDEEAPENAAATTGNDNRITEQVWSRAIICKYCVDTKPNRIGHSRFALCYRCSDNRSKRWRVCTDCFSSRGPYSIYDSYYSFCARCIK